MVKQNGFSPSGGNDDGVSYIDRYGNMRIHKMKKDLQFFFQGGMANFGNGDTVFVIINKNEESIIVQTNSSDM